jgi:hypothetical protein
MGINWFFWLLPVIALGIWILSNLLTNREEEKRPARPVRRPAAGDESGRPQQPVLTDLDRFLQEVNRRRQAAEARAANPAQARPPVPAPVPIAERPARVPRPEPAPPRVRPVPTSQPARRSTPRPSPPVRRSSTRDEPPLALPVEVVVARASDRVPERAAIIFPAAAPAPVAPPNSPEEAPPPVRRSQSSGSLRELLTSRDSVRTAIVLREIFDPPLAARTGRTPRPSK